MVKGKKEQSRKPENFVPGYNEQFGTRISSVIKAVGGLKNAGGIAGVTDEQVARWRDGASKPSFFGLAALCQSAGMSMDWLITGENGDPSVTIEDVLEKGGGYVLIPRYDATASAGGGFLNENVEVIDFMAFRDDWIRSTLGARPRDLTLITAVGDSMEPTIKDGDLLLVDRGVSVVSDDAIYVLVKQDHLVVKRIETSFKGEVTIISDNPAHPPEVLSEADLEQLHVAGRVRWFGRQLR